MNAARFQADSAKCIGCGKCEKVCPGGLIYLDKNQKAQMDHIRNIAYSRMEELAIQGSFFLI